jgi:hypothetical protein
LAWRQDTCYLSLDRTEGPVTIALGCGRWISGRANAPGLIPWLPMFERVVRPSNIAIAGAFAWKDEYTLVLRLQYPETPHHRLMTVRVSDDGLALEANDGYAPVSQFSGKI